MNIEKVLTELGKFSPEVISFQPKCELTRIQGFEERFSLSLPRDYKYFLAKSNGVELFGQAVYGVADSGRDFGLEDAYLFEHFETNNNMPLHLVPFSPDGYGNHYCFDTRTIVEASHVIVFWQHDYAYDTDDEPEIVYQSFSEWVQEVLINWTLEDYDFDGSEKNAD